MTEYVPYAMPVGPILREAVTYMCLSCGSLAGDIDAHTAWHERVEPR